MVRSDRNDQVFITSKESTRRSSTDVKEKYEHGQPVLLGTTSIENSEADRRGCSRRKLPHQVLNAKQHAREAEIVIQAGRRRWSPSPPTWRAAARTSCWRKSRARHPEGEGRSGDREADRERRIAQMR